MRTKRALLPNKTGDAEKLRKNRKVRQRHTSKASRKSAMSEKYPTQPATQTVSPVSVVGKGGASTNRAGSQRKRFRKLVAMVETKGREWTLTLRRPDGTFAALAIGKPGFVLDAQVAALKGGVRALRAFPAGGRPDA